MKDDRDWIPDATDLDWIESIAAPLPPAARGDRGRRRAARHPDRRPRHGPGAAALAGGRRRIVEVGTAYGYSTLWLALGQPADGTIVTIDPDPSGPTSPAAGGARPASPTSGSPGQRPGPRGVRGGRPGASPGRSTSPSSTRSSRSTAAYLDALIDGAARAAARSSSPTTSCGAVASPARAPVEPGDREHGRAARVLRAGRGDPRFTATILPLGDGLLVGDVARLSAAGSMRVRVRLFAIQRELAGTREVAARPAATAATVADAWDGARRASTRPWHPAATRSASRATAPTPTPATPPRRWRRGGDDPAGVGRRGRRAARAPRILELARDAVRRRRSWPSSTDRLATPEDGAAVGFLGPDAVDARDAGAGPGGGGRAPRRPGGRVARVRGPRVDGPRRPRRHRRRDRRALRRRPPGDRPPDRRGAARRVSIAVVAVARIATRPSRPPATRSTRPRPARRSGRPSGSRTATSGSASPARTGPPTTGRSAREGLHQRRHGGHRRDQPPRPDRPEGPPLPDVGRAHGRRDERRDRGRARRRRDRHPRQRQPLEHVQPAARGPASRSPASSRARRRGRWSPAPSPAPTAAPCVRRRAVRRLPRAGRAPDAGRSPTPTRGRPVETRLDGRPTGEYGFNALVLGAWGIPVGLVAGDDALAEEVADWLPWAERVVVKIADGGRTARISSHPTVARERVRERRRAGRPAGRRRRAASRSTSSRRSSSRSTYARGVVADHAAIVPGAERVGDRTVRFARDDPVHAYRGFLAINPARVEPVD